MDYKNAKIYKLISYQANDIYIGSTCSPLYKRLHEHKSHYLKWQEHTFNYISSFEIVKHGDAQILLIEEFPCDNKDQLRAREGHWIKTLECVNKKVAGRSKRQHYEDNKEEILEKCKAYRDIHKQEDKQRHHNYYEQHQQKIKARSKEYFENNKEKCSRLRNIRTQVNCECGGHYAQRCKKAHLTTNKHQNFIANKNVE